MRVRSSYILRGGSRWFGVWLDCADLSGAVCRRGFCRGSDHDAGSADVSRVGRCASAGGSTKRGGFAGGCRSVGKRITGYDDSWRASARLGRFGSLLASRYGRIERLILVASELVVAENLSHESKFVEKFGRNHEQKNRRCYRSEEHT